MTQQNNSSQAWDLSQRGTCGSGFTFFSQLPGADSKAGWRGELEKDQSLPDLTVQLVGFDFLIEAKFQKCVHSSHLCHCIEVQHPLVKIFLTFCGNTDNWKPIWKQNSIHHESSIPWTVRKLHGCLHLFHPWFLTDIIRQRNIAPWSTRAGNFLLASSCYLVCPNNE